MVLQVKTSVTVGMAILVNLDAGIDLAGGERYEGVKTGFYQETTNSSDVPVTNIMIGIDLKFTANKENSRMILTF